MNFQDREIKVKIYSDEHIVTVEAGDTILESAMRENLDPPFSCQVGSCGMCVAKLISGEVEMECWDALTDGEVKEGLILTCQSHPITDDVFVNYD